MTTRDRTCAERIGEHKASRLEDFRDMLDRAAQDDDEKREEAVEEIHNTPLCVEVRRIWRIDLSTGGPGDWLEVHVDDDGDAGRIEYHFNDWFDHAAVTLDGEEYDVAEQFARYVTADFYEER